MTPGVKRTSGDDDDGEEELSGQEATTHRAVAARAMFLAQDRADIGYAFKELSRRMSKPKARDMKDMKRLGRYMIGKGRVQVRFERQDKCNVIDIWTDTDYAGCTETRKSTSGGLALLGRHMVKGWANTQSVIALSSREAEFYGLVRGHQ